MEAPKCDERKVFGYSNNSCPYKQKPMSATKQVKWINRTQVTQPSAWKEVKVKKSNGNGVVHAPLEKKLEVPFMSSCSSSSNIFDVLESCVCNMVEILEVPSTDEKITTSKKEAMDETKQNLDTLFTYSKENKIYLKE